MDSQEMIHRINQAEAEHYAWLEQHGIDPCEHYIHEQELAEEWYAYLEQEISKQAAWDEYFMKMVYLVASKSYDTTKVGAVVVNDNHHIISTGYNHFPRGMELVAPLTERPTKYFYTEHAERNSVYAIADSSNSARGATMYTSGIPCHDCARAVIQAGIEEIVIHKYWPRNGLDITEENKDHWSESILAAKEMLDKCGVTIRVYEHKLGVKGFFNGKEIDV